jgi:serine/threonine-protein kinase Chk1
MAFSTVDKRKCQLHGEITIQPVSTFQLVSFRRSKGDPLEFKRLFKAIIDSGSDLIQ